MKPVLGALLASCVLGSSVVSCGTAAPLGASDANLAKAKSQASQGSSLFEQTCGKCHGDKGEGLAGAAPPVIGPTALPRFPRDGGSNTVYQDPATMQRLAQQRVPGQPSRPEFVSAQDLHHYLGVHLQELGIGARPTPEDYWAIVSFMLIAHGSEVPSSGISEANGGSVLIQSK
jgi:hypothetical protein